MRESGNSGKERVAKDLLREREGDVVRGLPITPRTNRVTFEELAADVVNDSEERHKVLLERRQVDFAAGTVRLDPGTTKNGEGRVFPMTAELWALLDAQRAYTQAVQQEQGAIIPHVFHRKGKPIKSFRKVWASACKAAGCVGRIRHDFRRTAVRNLVHAGIPERVAMSMTGHKTRSVFERYNIVSPSDLIEAARKLDRAAVTPAATAEGTPQ